MASSNDRSPAYPDASDLGLPDTPGSVVSAVVTDAYGPVGRRLVALTSDKDDLAWIILDGPFRPDRFVAWSDLDQVVVLFTAQASA